MGKRLKKLCCILLIITLPIFIGCQKDNQKVLTSDDTQKKESLANVVEYLESNDLETGKIIGKAYDMMGAVEGFGIIVEGEQIELYRFDPETATEETKKNLESAKSIGAFSMSGFSFPVILNGNVMLVRYEDHPNKDKIIEIFNNYNE